MRTSHEPGRHGLLQPRAVAPPHAAEATQLGHLRQAGTRGSGQGQLGRCKGRERGGRRAGAGRGVRSGRVSRAPHLRQGHGLIAAQQRPGAAPGACEAGRVRGWPRHAQAVQPARQQGKGLRCTQARRACLGDVMTAGVGDTFGDAWMRQTMNPEEAGGWRRQADFLITALALRDAAERGDAPQVDLPDDAFVT